MYTGAYQSITFLIVIVGFYIMDFLMIKRHDRRRLDSGSGRAWDFTLIIFLTAAVLVLQPIFLPYLSWSTKAAWGAVLQIIGILILIVALILHIWARNHLRHFYAERVEVQTEHKVITSGPYAYVRHPIITSFFGLAIGMCLVNPSLVTVIILIYTFWDFSRAARQEEHLLSKTLPDYAAYAAQTPRYLPRLRRKL